MLQSVVSLLLTSSAIFSAIQPVVAQEG